MKRLPTIGAVALAVMLVIGVGRLFMIRFQSGDIFPPYSSLRSDPLGTRVLYESLAACDGLTVERNYLSLRDLLDTDPPSPEDTALLFLGDPTTHQEVVPRTLYRLFGRFLRKGGRLVVVMLPRNYDPNERKEWQKNRKQEQKRRVRMRKRAKSRSKDKQDDEEEDKRYGPCADTNCCPPDTEGICPRRMGGFTTLGRWFSFKIDDVPVFDTNAVARIHAFTNGPLPQTIPCHTSVIFTNLVSDWSTVYERDGHPVVIQRSFGEGSIVFSAPSFFVSNEAMREDRLPALLAWLVGNKTRVIVDEHHHHISRTKNVSELMRRHGLFWLAVPLVAVIVLFVWQTNTYLVPPTSDARKGSARLAEGKDSSAALTNLLRTNLSPSAVMLKCVQEWLKTTNIRPDDPRRSRVSDIGAHLPDVGHHAKLIEAYNNISTFLKNKHLTTEIEDEKETT